MIILLSAFLFLAADAPRQEQPGLDAEGYRERQSAEKVLWSKGRDSIGHLEDLSAGKDPEVAYRARRLLRWIDLELTPESPEKVVEAVEGYLAAETMQEREGFYQLLLEEKAYVPLFRLPRHVRDESVASNLAERVAELSATIAEEKVLANDEEGALQILAESRDTQDGLMRWVSLASALGLREKLWDTLSKEEKIQWARWESDIPTLRELADEDDESLQVLRVLDGDPTGYLEEVGQKSDLRGIRARLNLARWNGEDTTSQLKALEALAQEGGDIRPEALQVIGQAGRTEAVFENMDDFNEVDFFGYFATNLEFAKALDIYGLKPGEPIPDEWLEERLDEINGEWDPNNEGCAAIYEVGGFLANNGWVAEAEKLFRAAWKEFNDKEDSLYFLLAISFFRQGMVTEGLCPHLAAELAKESGIKKWDAEYFISEFFNGNLDFVWWERIEEIRKDWDPWTRWLYLLDLMGLRIRLDSVERDSLYKDLVEGIMENDPGEDDLAELHVIISAHGDMVGLEKILKLMLEKDPERSEWRNDLAFLQIGWERYGEAADNLVKLVEENPADRSMRVALYASLVMAGRQEEALAQRSMLEKLSIGQSGWLSELAALWTELGENERAYQCRRLAQLRGRWMIGKQRSDSWEIQLGLFAESARAAGHWLSAASAGEVAEAASDTGISTFPQFIFERRGEIAFALAMEAFEAGNPEKGRAHLDFSHRVAGYQSFYANDVYLTLNQRGLGEEAARLWDQSKEIYDSARKHYPDGDNVGNSAAWVASRAGQDLENALASVNRALELKPDYGAYLDTKAEVHFAMGNREEAIKWSQKACEHAASVRDLIALRLQYRHFANDPIPGGN